MHGNQMTDTSFTVGRYVRRDGLPAIVHFILQQPAASPFILVGETLNKSGEWFARAWRADGTILDPAQPHNLDILLSTVEPL